jgi:hypothetical protein
MNLRHILTYALGAIEALLLARLVLRLMAARPNNPVVAALYAATAPRGPLAALDAGQPRFGATFELSTLALFLLILIATLLASRLWSARSRPAMRRGTR